MTKKIPGINIQYPISRLILSGQKTIETRTYPIPQTYIGREMVIIETPGRTGRFEARIIGKVVFGVSFLYRTRSSFDSDVDKHCVTPDSPWYWSDEAPKWGWPILEVQGFQKPLPAPKNKGIKFTTSIEL